MHLRLSLGKFFFFSWLTPLCGSPYLCLAPACEATFPNQEGLEKHYELHANNALPQGHTLPSSTFNTNATGPLHFSPSWDIGFSQSGNRHVLSNDIQDTELGSSNTLYGDLPTMGLSVISTGSMNGASYGLPIHFDDRLAGPSNGINYDLVTNNYDLSTVEATQNINGGFAIGSGHPSNPWTAHGPTPSATNTTPTHSTSAATFPNTNDQTNRSICPTCSKTFGRSSDLQRHAKKHEVGGRRYECSVEGCVFVGERGFYRRDKLLSHMRNRHGLVD